MNNNGQAMLVSIMVFLFCFVAATALMPSFFETTDNSRTDMGCSYDNLSTGDAAACIVVDLTPAFFLAVVISAGAGIITRFAGG